MGGTRYQMSRRISWTRLRGCDWFRDSLCGGNLCVPKCIVFYFQSLFLSVRVPSAYAADSPHALYSSSADGTVRGWDVRSGKQVTGPAKFSITGCVLAWNWENAVQSVLEKLNSASDTRFNQPLSWSWLHRGCDHSPLATC